MQRLCIALSATRVTSRAKKPNKKGFDEKRLDVGQQPFPFHAGLQLLFSKEYKSDPILKAGAIAVNLQIPLGGQHSQHHP